MKKLTRMAAALTAAALMVSCVSPYQSQMGALHHAYVNGQVSQGDYNREMAHLQMADAGWHQSTANAAATAAIVGAAALGTAALWDNHHHHHGHWGHHH